MTRRKEKSASEIAVEQHVQQQLAQYQQWAEQVLSPFTPTPRQSSIDLQRRLQALMSPDFVEQPKSPTINSETLTALKTAQSQRITRRVPDYTHVLTGWRGWRVTEDNGEWRLQALGQSQIWNPREILTAKCTNGGSGLSQLLGSSTSSKSSHPAPAWDCKCGVWAFRDIDLCVKAIGTEYASVKVIGSVSLWGKVIETEHGWRAQYAYPSELWLLDNSLEELGLIYDVPIRKV